MGSADGVRRAFVVQGPTGLRRRARGVPVTEAPGTPPAQWSSAPLCSSDSRQGPHVVPADLSSFLTLGPRPSGDSILRTARLRRPVGHLQTKDAGVPWSSPFKIQEYGRSPIAMHILLTPYWACGLLGGQKPRSFPETRALSPAAV